MFLRWSLVVTSYFVSQLSSKSLLFLNATPPNHLTIYFSRLLAFPLLRMTLPPLLGLQKHSYGQAFLLNDSGIMKGSPKFNMYCHQQGSLLGPTGTNSWAWRWFYPFSNTNTHLFQGNSRKSSWNSQQYIPPSLGYSNLNNAIWGALLINPTLEQLFTSLRAQCGLQRMDPIYSTKNMRTSAYTICIHTGGKIGFLWELSISPKSRKSISKSSSNSKIAIFPLKYNQNI